MRNIKNITTPKADENGQETAGRRCSIDSTHLGLVALIVLIITLAIAIGLRIQDSLRNRSEMCMKCDTLSQTLSQTKEKSLCLCDILKNLSECPCPSGWKLHNQTCYRFSIDTVNWDTAKRECESQNSHLLIINTQQEKNFVTQSLPNKYEQYFIGLSDRESEGNWIWVDGTPVSDSHWLPDEPNNFVYDEDCGTFVKEPGEDNFGCNDAPCTMEFPFICEKPARSCIGAADFEKYCP